METRTFGKAEIEQLIEDQRKQGNYQIAQEIKRSISKQDKELVKYETQFAYYGMMIITSIVGYLARKATAKYLE